MVVTNLVPVVVMVVVLVMVSFVDTSYAVGGDEMILVFLVAVVAVVVVVGVVAMMVW